MSVGPGPAQADLFDVILAPARIGTSDESVTVELEAADAEAVAGLADRLGITRDAIWAAGWALLLARLAGIERVRVAWAGTPLLIDAPASGDAASWLADVTSCRPSSGPTTNGRRDGLGEADPPPQSEWAASEQGPAEEGGPALIWSLRSDRGGATAVARFRGVAGADGHDLATGNVGHRPRGIERASVEHLAGLLRTTVAALGAPGARLETISLPVGERTLEVEGWNRSASGYRTEGAVHGQIPGEAARNPERVTVARDEGPLTASEPALPLSGSGKVERTALPAPSGPTPGDQGSGTARQRPTEQIVAAAQIAREHETPASEPPPPLPSRLQRFLSSLPTDSKE